MDPLIETHDGPVTRLTLNRPDKANALSALLVEALMEAVERTRTNGTRLLILEGAGSHFCAGFDFTDYEKASEGDLALRFIRIETLLQALYHGPFETLALAHGRVFGAGADIVASCGLRIATLDTVFLMPGLQFGVVLGTQRFAARVGAERAHETLAASRSFGAEEALHTGFLTQIAEKDRWDDIVASARTQSERLSPAAAAALRVAVTSDTRAADMAALVSSVSTPGIKERIREFRGAQKR